MTQKKAAGQQDFSRRGSAMEWGSEEKLAQNIFLNLLAAFGIVRIKFCYIDHSSRKEFIYIYFTSARLVQALEQ